MGQTCCFIINAPKNSPFGRFLGFCEIFHVLKTFTTQYVSFVFFKVETHGWPNNNFGNASMSI